jgi:hypothetical protein
MHWTIVLHMVEPSLLTWYAIASAYWSGPNFDSMVQIVGSSFSILPFFPEI